MKQFLEFVHNHWQLWVGLVVAVIWLIFEETKAKIGGAKRASVHEATLLINRVNATIIDLRSQTLFAKGHIIGAINIAKNELDANMAKLTSQKEQAIVLVDEHESLAAPVGAKLLKQGFTKIYILAGGLPAWKEAHLPLTHK